MTTKKKHSSEIRVLWSLGQLPRALHAVSETTCQHGERYGGSNSDCISTGNRGGDGVRLQTSLMLTGAARTFRAASPKAGRATHSCAHQRRRSNSGLATTVCFQYEPRSLRQYRQATGEDTWPPTAEVLAEDRAPPFCLLPLANVLRNSNGSPSTVTRTLMHLNQPCLHARRTRTCKRMTQRHRKGLVRGRHLIANYEGKNPAAIS